MACLSYICAAPRTNNFCLWIRVCLSTRTSSHCHSSSFRSGCGKLLRFIKGGQNITALCIIFGPPWESVPTPPQIFPNVSFIPITYVQFQFNAGNWIPWSSLMVKSDIVYFLCTLWAFVVFRPRLVIASSLQIWQPDRTSRPDRNPYIEHLFIPTQEYE